MLVPFLKISISRVNESKKLRRGFRYFSALRFAYLVNRFNQPLTRTKRLMKSSICIFYLVMLFSFNAMAQIRYAEGYFIDHDNKTTKCLIYHVDWLNNPEVFKYKLSADGDVLTSDFANVKEFGVAGSKYVKAEVQVDTSAQVTKNLTYNRHPEWKNMSIYLRVLLEGKASLYAFRTPDLEKFFYSVDGAPIKQLVYKEFLMPVIKREVLTSPVPIGKNLAYLQQLKVDVMCCDMSDAMLRKIPYEKTALQKYFQKFNVSHGGTVAKRLPTDKIRLAITPGVDFSKFKLSDGFNYDKNYEPYTTVRLGMMVEYVLPFNNGKWSLILEPTYQSYRSGDLVDYKSIELPLGARHNFFLSQNASIFVNGYFVVDKPLTYEVQWTQSITYTSKSPSTSFAAGLGGRINKFSIEARKYFTRSALGNRVAYFFVYDKFSVIVGYRIK